MCGSSFPVAILWWDADLVGGLVLSGFLTYSQPVRLFVNPYEQTNEENRSGYWLETMITWFGEHRLIVSFFVMLFGMMAVDAAAKLILQGVNWETWLHLTERGVGLPVDFAPEVWLATVAMILGTLIIVISIASQSTPKLIDLYMRNWWSLAYLWFMVLAMVFNIWLQRKGNLIDTNVRIDLFLYTYIYLPAAMILAVPYVFYMLSNTKTSRVIQLIHSENLRRISKLTDRFTGESLEDPTIAKNYQMQLIESFNQFDDLLQYTPFKEPKALIMTRIGGALKRYVAAKPDITPTFFKVSPEAMEDISFLTIKDQRKQIEKARSFYELKGFRILSNQYAKLITNDEFDLASLCASQFVEVARAAGKTKLEEGLLEIITIQFNTLMRFAINHGIKNSESRHIYNLMFFYRQFILETASAGHVEIVEDACDYLKLYSGEIYRHSETIAAFKFLVDVCVAEMRTILEYLSISKWPEKDQRHVLDMLLKMDDAPEDKVEASGAGSVAIRSIGVRVIQLGLALFYMKHGQTRLVDAILDDFIDLTTRSGIEELSSLMWTIVNRLQTEPELFWEVTDRGNQNIYYCPHTDAIPDLMDRFQKELGQNMSTSEVEMFGNTVNGHDSDRFIDDTTPTETAPIVEPPVTPPIDSTDSSTKPAAKSSYRIRRR